MPSRRHAATAPRPPDSSTAPSASSTTRSGSTASTGSDSRPSGGTRPEGGPLLPSGARAAQQARGKPDDRTEEREHALNGDPDQAERQQEHPDDGIEDEGQKRQRPAHHQQQQPEQEPGHRHASCLVDTYGTGRGFTAGAEKGSGVFFRSLK